MCAIAFRPNVEVAHATARGHRCPIEAAGDRAVRQRARVVCVIGGSGLVALLLAMTTPGTPAATSLASKHPARDSRTQTNHPDARTHNGAARHHQSGGGASSTSTSTTTVSGTSSTLARPTSLGTSTTSSTTSTTTTTTTTVPTTTTPSPQLVRTTRFVNGRLAPPFTSTTIRQRTAAGVASVVITWSGSGTLHAQLVCGDRSQQRTAPAGLYLAVHAPPGVCSVSVSEAPVVSTVFSYELELTYEERVG